MAVLTRRKLQALAALRLQEAQALFDVGLFDGSVYLAGYVPELALKACICRALRIEFYPETDMKGAFKTHLLKDLVLVAGLRGRLQEHEELSRQFADNWQAILKLGPEQRYEADKSKSDAAEILTALTSPEGVLTWLSQQW